MALRFYLRNKSTGEDRFFRFDNSFDDEVSQVTDGMSWLKANRPDIASIVKEGDIVGIDRDAGHPITSYVDTVGDVKEFLDRRNADAEWDIPEGMLYKDWLVCMDIICTDIDSEAIDFDETRIWVCDYDAEFIDWACERLTKEGRHLTCHKHIFKDCYTREFEDEVIL